MGRRGFSHSQVWKLHLQLLSLSCFQLVLHKIFHNGIKFKHQRCRLPPVSYTCNRVEIIGDFPIVVWSEVAFDLNIALNWVALFSCECILQW